MPARITYFTEIGTYINANPYLANLNIYYLYLLTINYKFVSIKIIFKRRIRKKYIL